MGPRECITYCICVMQFSVLVHMCQSLCLCVNAMDECVLNMCTCVFVCVCVCVGVWVWVGDVWCGVFVWCVCVMHTCQNIHTIMINIYTK